MGKSVVKWPIELTANGIMGYSMRIGGRPKCKYTKKYVKGSQMKSFIISTTTLATFAFVGQVQAKIIPELDTALPKTSAECIIWAGSRALELNLCDEITKCEVDHTNDAGSYRECLGEAYRKYEISQTTPEKLEDEIPYAGEELPVGTESENSDYYMFDGERKGWTRQHQGD